MKKILFGLLLFISSCGADKSTDLPDNFQEEKERFISSLESFQESNKISSGLPNVETAKREGQERKMKKLINEGIETSEKISDDFLKYLHPELSEYFKGRLVKSNKLYIEGISGDYDLSEAIQKQIEANKLLAEWGSYWADNFDQINKQLTVKSKKTFGQKIKRLTSVNESKRSYWRMFLRFIISNFISIFVFSFFVIALLLPLVPIGLLGDKIKSGLATIVTIPFILIAGVGQAYFWALWAAYCAQTVQIFIANPAVTQSWIYYATGFFSVTGPIGWLSSKESQSAKTYDDQKRIQGGTFYYSLISVVAFIVFSIWTDILNSKYISWLNDWLL
jgi:hypothetical protein